jgi:hypothetical protein
MYKYLTTDVVAKIDDDGISRVSCSIENEEFKAWLAEGNTPEPVDLPHVIIPTEVSMRQARLALFQQDKLSLIQPLIDAMIEPAKTTTQISWDYATIVQRDDDLVVQLSAAMGLTSVDLDALFTLASTL